jgi:hypothetical protein
MPGVIDVTKYERLIRQEADRRFAYNQESGIEGMNNRARAKMQHTIGVAGEVAANLHLDLDPYDVVNDAIGKADIEHDGHKFDVKTVLSHRRIVNVQYYESIFEHKGNWQILVMLYEGFGWRFVFDQILPFRALKSIPLTEPKGGHRSQHWAIDLDTWNNRGK